VHMYPPPPSLSLSLTNTLRPSLPQQRTPPETQTAHRDALDQVDDRSHGPGPRRLLLCRMQPAVPGGGGESGAQVGCVCIYMCVCMTTSLSVTHYDCIYTQTHSNTHTHTHNAGNVDTCSVPSALASWPRTKSVPNAPPR
jgi:hypothetical protein